MALVASNLSSGYDLKYAEVPICDIFAGSKMRKSQIKEESTKVVKKRIVKVICDKEESPKVVKKRIVKVICDKDGDKENTDSEKDDDSDYEIKEVKPKKKISVYKNETFKNIKKEIVPQNKYERMTPYEIMIEEKRAERIALLKSMEIDQIKSDITEAIGGIRQLKKKSITKSDKKVQYHPSNEPLRRSKRLANIDGDLSEYTLKKFAVKSTFQKTASIYESLPSEFTFKEALETASSYEECVRDLSVHNSKKFDHNFISYDKALLKNMMLNEFCISRVVPSKITSGAWFPSKNDLVVAVGDLYGNLGLWKIQDSETTPYLFRVHYSIIPSMRFCLFNPVHLITASYDGTMRCGDLLKHKFSEIYASDTNCSTSSRCRCTWFDFLSPSTFLVSQSDGKIALVDKKTRGISGEKRHTCHDHLINTVCVHPINRNIFLTAGIKKIIRLWDLRKLETKPVVEIEHHKKSVNSAYFSPVTGNTILTTSVDDTICIFDSTNLTADIKLKAQMRHNNCNDKATWLPNSDDYFAVCSMGQSRKIEIFDRDLNPYHSIINDYMTITSVHSFHPFRSVLAAGSPYGKLFVFT